MPQKVVLLVVAGLVIVFSMRMLMKVLKKGLFICGCDFILYFWEGECKGCVLYNFIYYLKMINEELKIKLTGMRYEIIDLNQLSYFYVQKSNRMIFIARTTTREFWLEELLALRYLENGIILHLTNLDDDNSKYSFRTAQTLINKSNLVKNQSTLKELKDKIDNYRRDVNNLKTKHRNARIAHINSTDLPRLYELDFEIIFKPLIRQANEIADFIWGQKIDVMFKLGSFEGILDFRKLQETLSIDANKNKGFHHNN